MVLLMLIPMVAATTPSLGIFEQSTDIELIQLCSNKTALCDYCNISSIKYPNSSSIFSDVAMTKRSGDFNYTLILNYTEPLGEYDVSGYCGFNGGDLQVFSYTVDVTANGNERPDSGVIVFFIILFCLEFIGLFIMMMYNIFHIAQWDLDAKDLIINFALYSGLFITLIFGKEYLGNVFFNDWIIWFIGITGFTNIILPAFGFVMSIVKGGLDGMKP